MGQAARLRRKTERARAFGQPLGYRLEVLAEAFRLEGTMAEVYMELSRRFPAGQPVRRTSAGYEVLDRVEGVVRPWRDTYLMYGPKVLAVVRRPVAFSSKRA